MIDEGQTGGGPTSCQGDNDGYNLARYLEWAEENTQLSFGLFREECNIIQEILCLFAALKRALHGIEAKRGFAPILIDKSLAYALAALRTAMAGQPAEARPTARAAIESALYAYQMVRCPDEEADERACVYLGRQRSDEDHRASRRMYRSPTKILDTLAAANATLGTRAKTIYQRSIDEGAHPNALAFVPYIHMSESGGVPTIEVSLLVGNPDHIKYGVRAVVRCALVSLDICAYAFDARADAAGLTELLKALHGRVNDLPPLLVRNDQSRDAER